MKILKITLSSALSLLPAVVAAEDIVTCTGTEYGSVFSFGDKWATHEYKGANTGKPHLIEYECYPAFKRGFACWEEHDAERPLAFGILDWSNDTQIVVVNGNMAARASMTVIYDVTCDGASDLY